MSPLTLDTIRRTADLFAGLGLVRVTGCESWIDESLRGIPAVSCDLGMSAQGRSMYVSYRVGDLAPETRAEAEAVVAVKLKTHRMTARRTAAILDAERNNQR